MRAWNGADGRQVSGKRGIKIDRQYQQPKIWAVKRTRGGVRGDRKVEGEFFRDRCSLRKSRRESKVEDTRGQRRVMQ